ncbi:hypothetical protein C440_09567 [Haloferax mucosum ATCC BAA-1512]|uniref:Uncharacterized protein n=1 Tax=Haloferax mucosum ATCC BAA-1512 TaxID=662479 RepID=M0IEW8_9EURY|nr:hypothetical protein [Haloferax mucosum]ELZ95316.1 hypothetical protein C440_09567 [Haloferax mucosum ATCC BAA-1512]
MRELRTCDFCGTDAVGVFEVLPPELTPADDQRRVILCEHCQETLTDVIAPLLSRLGVGADVDIPDDAPAETGASTTPTRAGGESVGNAASVDVESVDPAPTPDESTDGQDDKTGGESVETEPSGDEPTTGEPTEGDSPDPLGDAGHSATSVEADETSENDSETTPGVEADQTGASDASETESADEEKSGDSDMRPEPPKFRKVIRILQNREFPVERAEIESLASGAYDLDDDEVADIFDYAIERDLLVDDGGMLRRP